MKCKYFLSVNVAVKNTKAFPFQGKKRKPRKLEDVCVCDVYACAVAVSRVQLSVIPWSIAQQAPLSMGFSRQEYWSGLPFPSPGDLPDPGMESGSPSWQVASLPLSHLGSPYACVHALYISMQHVYTQIYLFIHKYTCNSMNIFSLVLA